MPASGAEERYIHHRKGQEGIPQISYAIMPAMCLLQLNSIYPQTACEFLEASHTQVCVHGPTHHLWSMHLHVASYSYIAQSLLHICIHMYTAALTLTDVQIDGQWWCLV